jgi:hypothetical protein
MIKSRHRSAARNQKFLKHFMQRATEKNLKGIREHGGGLERKNTLPEIMAEIMDLVNYAVEHEEQVGKLVAAAYIILANADQYLFDYAAIPKLRAALAPFLNKSTKGND